MRRPSFFLALSLSLTLAACSSGKGDDDDGAGDDDGGGGTIDAGDDVRPDADTSANLTMGRPCNPAQNDCPTEAPVCQEIPKVGEPKNAICTKACGTNTSDTPPADGDAICQAGYQGTATPACMIAQTQQGSETRSWRCGLQCGQIGASDWGTCPEPLVCVDKGMDAQGNTYIDNCE
jgi:hypothetical protein